MGNRREDMAGRVMLDRFLFPLEKICVFSSFDC